MSRATRFQRRMTQPLSPRTPAPIRQAVGSVANDAAVQAWRDEMTGDRTTSQIEITPAGKNHPVNLLRPQTLDQMIGQSKLKPLLRRLVDASKASGRPMDHLLLVGASGTGKTTVATVISNEIGHDVYLLKAPVALDVLEALRTSAKDGDVIFVDEIHMQVSGDRRGITQACDPEAFYMLLEDGVLATSHGQQAFPRVTWIGATTDVGLLPEAMTNRFPLQPRLAPYTIAEMTQIADYNAHALGLVLAQGVAATFGGASRCNPRQVNAYVRSARALATGVITNELAREIVEDLCSTTLDGLTESMQTVLRFLLKNCRRVSKGEVVYSASVNTLATACGHGRDTKAIALLVEPELLRCGFLSITPQGRQLTNAGIERAKALLAGPV
jgi:Holliday junction DNA helicase RuvB